MYTRPINKSAAYPVVPPVTPVARSPVAPRVNTPGSEPVFPLAQAAAAPMAPAGVYVSVGHESAAMKASPAQLITMLFEAARSAIVMARAHMARGDAPGKGRAISRAVNIIGNGLKASLDAKTGGAEGAELVDRLEPLYDYICQRLVLGNLRNDPALLNEAERLLENVASAWREVTARHEQGQPGGHPGGGT
jgi:flagellar secretion chaperone FliS